MKKTLLMLVGCTALAMAAELATVHPPFATQVGQNCSPPGNIPSAPWTTGDHPS